MPTLTVVAGPNGAGKSSVTTEGRLIKTPNLIDPDAIARALNPSDPAQAALSAGRRALRLEREFVAKGESFTFETTLAGNGPLSTVRAAKLTGFEIVVVFIALDSVEVHVERVRLRKSRGGHDVPEEDIRRRYQRSLANAPEALRIADRGIVLNNTEGEAIPLLVIKDGAIVWKRDGVLPIWAVEIERALNVR